MYSINHLHDFFQRLLVQLRCPPHAWHLSIPCAPEVALCRTRVVLREVPQAESLHVKARQVSLVQYSLVADLENECYFEKYLILDKKVKSYYFKKKYFRGLAAFCYRYYYSKFIVFMYLLFKRGSPIGSQVRPGTPRTGPPPTWCKWPPSRSDPSRTT